MPAVSGSNEGRSAGEERVRTVFVFNEAGLVVREDTGEVQALAVVRELCRRPGVETEPVLDADGRVRGLIVLHPPESPG